MPLPTGGKWPPAETLATVDRMNVWSAWYTGDTFELERVHGGTLQIADNPAAPPSWPRQEWLPLSTATASGAAYKRTFWGSRIPGGEQRMKLHIPSGSDIAAISADLLFAEPPTLAGADDATTARLDDYIEDGMWPSLRESAELGAALGGVFLRVVWDSALEDHPWLTSVAPDLAVPEWSWDRLTAVTFYRVICQDGSKVVRHLERHEPGAILHGCYEGTADSLGERVPLASHPETECFAGSADAEGVIPTGTMLLTAAYVPNIRPNRIWRSIPAAANLGRSDFSGVEPLMDALDETWSSWMRDIRLAKARLIVDTVALESYGKGKGAHFDADREVFTALDLGPGGDGGNLITPSQFAIRAADHQQTAAALFEQIIRGSGYSVATMSGGAEQARLTATEVVSRERRSLVTRGRKVSYWRSGLSRILTALLAVDNAQFGAGVSEECPTVTFPEDVFVDPAVEALTVQALADAEAISIDTRVRMVHPHWTAEQVDAEVALINGEVAPPAPAPMIPQLRARP